MTRDDAMHKASPDAGDDAMMKIDAELRGLPPLDAPERTVRRTLERVAAARERAPGRSMGWVLVAAASFVGLVGAWFTARSFGGDATPNATPVDALARYEQVPETQRGRYRLRGSEVRAGLDLPSQDAAGELGDAVHGLFDGEGLPVSGTTEGRLQVVTLEEGRNELTPPENAAALVVTDKAGKLDLGVAAGDLGRDLRQPGEAGDDDRWRDKTSVVADAKAVGADAEGEDADKSQPEKPFISITAAPEGNERVDGKGWAAVVNGAKTDEAAVANDSLAPEDAGLLAAPAPADPTGSDRTGEPAEATRETKSLEQPVTSTTVATGEHPIVLDGDGVRDHVVVTRTHAAGPGVVVLAKETAKETGGEDVGGLEGVARKDESELGESDLRSSLDSGANQPAFGWWADDARRGGDADRGEEGAGQADDAPNEGDEGERTQATAELANQQPLAGKRALPARALVPPASAVEGVPELAPRGYFRNTYLPGDPESSWLRTSLADRLTKDGEDLPLERAARPPVQPFAASGERGLGVSVTADRSAVAGPTRMTVQIGLAGADRAATRRAPLNLALVLDVAAVSSDAERQALWSLADALAAARQPGDRLAVVVTGAGPEQAQELSASELSGAEVRRALASAYETRLAPAAGDLDAALAQAVAGVRAGAREAAPLGADRVIVASSRSVAAEARAGLEERAREAAVSGIHVSAIGVGPRADGEALAALAAAGQGRRLLATDSEGARSVMARELVASGRAVARAVRLRIRLADGVKLVGVLGSEPLDAVDAERVRVAEQAIDKQLRAATGIASDRGADEDGIQVVIPAFYAGDRHVILLDVVAPGPGPLVDVRVRFKDLVALDNGEASASLTLGGNPTDAARTPVVRNVLANRAAYAIGEALSEASRALAAGDRGAARGAVASARAGLAALEASDPGLAAALAPDRALLDQYLALMRDADAWSGDPSLVAWVSRSLHLAARIKGVR